jgi:hypothetical protein
VTAGQSLVHQAQLRQIVSQINEIKTSVQTYKLEYNALPGDHANATDYWGVASDCEVVNESVTYTCNGNGNKKISYPEGSFDTSPRHESYQFWKQLKNSGLWKNNLIDFRTQGPFKNALWFVMSSATCSACNNWIGRAKNQTRNILVLGSNNSWFAGSYPQTPSEQYSIDIKIDDGMPYLGKIVDMSGAFSTNCNTGNNHDDITVTYNLAYADKACFLFVDLM